MANDYLPSVVSIELDALEKMVEKVVTSKNIKFFIKPSKTVINDIVKAAHTDQLNFQTIFRSFAITASSLIPYGGGFIAPLLELVWPNADIVKEKDNQLIELFSKIAKETVDEAIKTFDSAMITATLKTLKDEYSELESEFNNTTDYYSIGTRAERNRTKVEIINSNFKLALNQASKSGFEHAELPFYTAIATVYLLFIKSIKTNGKGSKLLLDDITYQEYVNLLPNFSNTSINHIRKIFFDYVEKNSFPTREYYYSTIRNATFWRVLELNTFIQENGKTFYLDDKGRKFTGWYSDRTSSHAYFPYLESNAYYYFSDKKTDKFELGEMVTGFFTDTDGREYYLSEKDNLSMYVSPEPSNVSPFRTLNKGELAVGYFELEGKRSFLATMPILHPPEFKEGELITRWVQDSHFHYYYFAPKDGTLNDAGEKFRKGQMMTGWIWDDQNRGWYYLTENTITNMDHTTFKRGQMVTGNIILSGSPYNFDSTGKCINCKPKK
ncbi:insecticidal delta-endotoxin Cry8Ea1 family protein [Bacillus cereus]|uniref:insecticidal delta-endotoxin Cry8Ea1 family protein n=1 Tax=Bacillus TaxID=1386 RepID=UPI0009AB0856|nr:insecticidal delta-endotoxin Cry8Ea1 family protein [Bacillus cereus]MCU5026405.1 insecticidal delta-endotoxin Cry8Ea1 family protein [Bacillus cereus]MCU5646216.1 insecticidal delta-endotoxin Cry8Ea1 family protein [Bacillus cereus]MDA2644459.1 insecticidal delta-endotoxin Cry8Ea1 family protein [Bacillus cereus]PFA42212.1 hypothetical protein CN381_22220 [Bacillus cereus]WCT66859.1 insecticidal delta-endotoxin Cry8Ea1 family protein [Bacillus cereus]